MTAVTQDLGQALFTASIDATGIRQLTPFTLDVGVKQSWAAEHGPPVPRTATEAME